MSSENHYCDWNFGGSDFDHGGRMPVRHYPDDSAGNPDEHKTITGDPTLAKSQSVAGLKPAEPTVPYKFREGELLAEIKAYIDGTYNQHYSQSKFQASEFIFDNGHGVGMNVGCIMKYAQRYGKKDGYNRKDILKIIHYAILLLYVHDEYIAKEKK